MKDLWAGGRDRRHDSDGENSLHTPFNESFKSATRRATRNGVSLLSRGEALLMVHRSNERRYGYTFDIPGLDTGGEMPAGHDKWWLESREGTHHFHHSTVKLSKKRSGKLISRSMFLVYDRCNTAVDCLKHTLLKGTKMRRLREATARGFESLSRAIRQQPDYETEISEEYLAALKARVDDQKPSNFALSPISEPGW